MVTGELRSLLYRIPGAQTNSDSRFIPNRAGQDLQASYNLLHDDGSPATPSKAKRTPHNELHFQKSALFQLTFETTTNNN